MQTEIDVRITGGGRFSANLEAITDAADAEVWASAVDVLRERSYGKVRVRSEWSSRDRIRIEVIDDRAQPDAHDVVSYAELFLHDAFLLFNIAVPGSFSGVITFGSFERMLDARVFENAWIEADRNGWPSIAPLPLADVVAWYDDLDLGTQQLASTGPSSALFHLLHLARGEEDDMLSIVRLTLAIEALFDATSIDALLGDSHLLREQLQTLLDHRDAIAYGTAPVTHPMHDDSLDPRVDDAALDYTETVDFASSVVIAALQALVRA